MYKLCSLATVFSILALSPNINAQSVTGQMYGVVTDSTGAIVSGASVKLTNDNSQAVISYETSSNGSFSFIGLFPAVYNLKVSHPGFKSYEQKNIRVNTQERVDLNTIKLEVGDITTSIAVEASAVRVATDSSDRAISIGLRQIEDTPTRGRNPLSLVMTLPGVQTLAGNDFRGWLASGLS